MVRRIKAQSQKYKGERMSEYIPFTPPEYQTDGKKLQELVDQGLGFWNEDGEFCLNLNAKAIQQQAAVDYFTRSNPYVAETD